MKAPLSNLDEPCRSKACICVSSGRQACSEDAAAGWGPRAGMLCVCCLNSGLSHCRSGGDEGRKWLHVYIAELSFSPPSVSNALLFKHSQVREMTPADAGVHSSASALHLNAVFVNSQTVKHWSPLLLTVGVCCLSLQACVMDKKYSWAQFITLRHKGRTIKER